MGMKRRICDGPCGKRRRFDADSWKEEGWIEIDRTDPFRPLRICPICAEKIKHKIPDKGSS